LNREQESQFFKIPGVAKPLQRDLFACIALAVASAGLYLRMLGAEFVYDARTIVGENGYIHHLRNLADVLTLHIMHMDVMDNNRPVYVANAILDWAVWRANPAGHHLMSIVFHATVVVLIFLFCRRLLGGGLLLPPFCAALIFAVHPLNCEAVAEVSYRKDLLAAVFVLAGLNMATAFQPVFDRRNMLVAAACVAGFFLAVGSKENGIAGPPVLICYWLLFRRNEARTGWIVLCAASCVVVGLFLIARFTLPPATSVIFTHKPKILGDSLQEAMFIQPRIFACYLRNIVWPHDLCADYGPYSVRNFDSTVSMVVVLAVIGVQAFFSTQNRMFALGAALFWLALLPVSNLVPIYRPMADRFLYLPMTGVAIMLASIPWERRRVMHGTCMVVVVLIAGALACVTFQREKVWHDSLALWSDTARVNPQSADSQTGLGSALLDAGKPAESVAAFERAIQLRKGHAADDYAGMALSLDAMGEKSKADEAFKKAVKIDGRYAHPDSLVEAMIWERKDAAKLKVIAYRN